MLADHGIVKAVSKSLAELRVGVCFTAEPLDFPLDSLRQSSVGPDAGRLGGPVELPVER